MPDRYPLPIYYDFSSTICYVAHRVLSRLAPAIDEIGVDLQWQPLDLTLLTGWRRGARVTGPGRANALRVDQELEVVVRMPSFWMDSRGAHCLALGLQGDAVPDTVWRERVWSEIYEQGGDIGDPAALENLARESGIDSARGVSIDRLDEITREAREKGVSAVPAFLIDRWPMGGIQDDHSMVKFFERYVRKRRRERAAS